MDRKYSAAIPRTLNNSFTVPQDKANQYSAIIDDILASSDLATITRKRIRKELQARLDRDISEDKVDGLADVLDLHGS